VREVTLGAHEHQIYPFDALVDALRLRHDRRRNPLFDVQVVLGGNAAAPSYQAPSLGSLQVSRYGHDILQTSRFDLVFGFSETPAGLVLAVQYNTDLYPEAYAARLAAHLEGLMTDVVAHPGRPLDRLAYLGEAEKDQLLDGFNPPATGFPAGCTVVDLFAEQARRHPGHAAVMAGATTLTYGELDAQSDRLAGYLRSQCRVRPGELVGILLDRSEKMIVSVLGVLKSGAAYVPIDPDYPRSRQEYIVQDTALRVLLTQTDYLFDLDFFTGELFAVDVQLDALEEAAPAPPLDPASLAYVLYTSGSTGRPKGVMIEHRSLVDLSHWQHAYFALDGTQRISQMGAFSFDGSVGECMMALTNGCTLVVIPREAFPDLVEKINQYRIDVVVTVPSVLRSLDPAGLTGRPRIVSVGEKCPVELFDRWKDHCCFINGYWPHRIHRVLARVAGRGGPRHRAHRPVAHQPEDLPHRRRPEPGAGGRGRGNLPERPRHGPRVLPQQSENLRKLPAQPLLPRHPLPRKGPAGRPARSRSPLRHRRRRGLERVSEELKAKPSAEGWCPRSRRGSTASCRKRPARCCSTTGPTMSSRRRSCATTTKASSRPTRRAASHGRYSWNCSAGKCRPAPPVPTWAAVAANWCRPCATTECAT
jgi:non-ribosomal peptide synthetase component F